MKKLIILAAAAIAAVACSRSFDTAPAKEQAIGFGTWTETLTKAISDPRAAGTNTFGVGDSFAVYGYKEASSTKTTVFEDVAVEMTVAGVPGTWTYSPTRYWDNNADQYVFYAISPSSVGTTAPTFDPQTGQITTAAIEFEGSNVASDVLVADIKAVAQANFGGPVQLDFNHVASLVDFKVNKAPNLADATVNITGFQLKNINKQGVMNVAANAYNAAVYNGATGLSPVVTWTPSAPGSYPDSPLTKDDISEDTAFVDPYGATPAASSDLIQLVVVPQTFAEPTSAMRDDPSTSTVQMLTISYDIVVTGGGSNSYTANLFLYDFDLVNNTAQTDTKVASWDTGKHYTFYITLDSKPIVFGASINDWTVGTGYHYLLN